MNTNNPSINTNNPSINTTTSPVVTSSTQTSHYLGVLLFCSISIAVVSLSILYYSV
jgi:hypothetical protein